MKVHFCLFTITLAIQKPFQMNDLIFPYHMRLNIKIYPFQNILLTKNPF